MLRKSILLTSFILFPLIASAQYRDESQMLFKPGTPRPHARVHSKNPSATIIPRDSLINSAAAAPLAGDEPGDSILLTGILLLQEGDCLAALKAFGKASQQGNHEAQYRIGLMYRDGTGIAQNDTEAAYWFRKAGSNGHAEALFETGVCFMEGKGVLQDNRMAAESYWKAAEHGHPRAALYVARMYRDGIGMEKNLKKARKYMKQAAEAGLNEAITELQSLPEK